MGLSDSVSASGLAFYPEVALLIFAATFALVALRVAMHMRSEDCERAGSLPLEDDAAPKGALGGEHVGR